jgi:hypothetical protein
MGVNPTRRRFLQLAGAGAAALNFGSSAIAKDNPKVIQGFEKAARDPEASKGWKPISDRKIRVALVGHGVCKFAAAFGFQDHPNVDVVTVSDLIPERCAELAKVARCKKTYPSLEELVKDPHIEAVFIATDAPSHARHLFETSSFHDDLYAMRQIYHAHGFGPLVYSEGEYFHYMAQPIDSYKGWRIGLPPQFYPTHSNAYYIGVTGGSFTEVSCMGIPSKVDHLQPANNRYKNGFGTEVALFRTSEGGMSRMAVSWDTPGPGGEMGRVRGPQGSFYGKYEGLTTNLPNTRRPALPPTLEPGGHGGSHGHLTNEFVAAILEDRQPLVNVAHALNMTVAGIVAHQSALKDGELMKIPQYRI